MKEARCIVYYRTGSFETDRLSITSPTGKTKSLFLHKKGLSIEQKNIIQNIILKVEKAQRIKYIFEKLCKPNIKDPNWSYYIKRLHNNFGDAFTLIVYLTYDELKSFKEISEI